MFVLAVFRSLAVLIILMPAMEFLNKGKSCAFGKPNTVERLSQVLNDLSVSMTISGRDTLRVLFGIIVFVFIKSEGRVLNLLKEDE